MVPEFTYFPGDTRSMRWELMDAFFLSKGTDREVYDLAFALHSNYDFNESEIQSYVADRDTPRSVALAIYWMLQPDHWLEEDDEDSGEYSSMREMFFELQDSYLRGVYRRSSVEFDPVAYFKEQFRAFEVPPAVPALFLQPTAGRKVNLNETIWGWDEGYPPEVWENIQIFWQLEDLTHENLNVTSVGFRDLVLQASRSGHLKAEKATAIDPRQWLGNDPQPLFPEWAVLPEAIWQPLSIIPAMASRGQQRR